MSRKTKLYDGKSKTLYATAEANEIIMHFRDDVIAADGSEKGKIKGKGAINNHVSIFLFKYLESYNVPTHFIKQESVSEMLVNKLEMIPVEVVMRNIAAGNLCERYGLEKGSELTVPVLEYYLKNDELKTPLMNEYHIYTMELATQSDLQFMAKQAIKINAVLKSLFQRRKILLVDLKLEFGKLGDKIALGDEISMDTCRLWDADDRESLDRDRHIDDAKRLEAIYREILERVVE